MFCFFYIRFSEVSYITESSQKTKTKVLLLQPLKGMMNPQICVPQPICISIPAYRPHGNSLVATTFLSHQEKPTALPLTRTASWSLWSTSSWWKSLIPTRSRLHRFRSMAMKGSFPLSMSSSQTEALFPRKLSSRSQVSGRASFIRFPALLESQGPGRRLREKACRLEGYLQPSRAWTCWAGSLMCSRCTNFFRVNLGSLSFFDTGL